MHKRFLKSISGLFLRLFLGSTILLVFHAQSALAEHLLRVGTISHGTTKLVVLGIDKSQESEIQQALSNAPTSQGVDFRLLGFQGEEIEKLDPKFLIEIRNRELYSVRAFESDHFDQTEKFLPISRINRSQLEKTGLDLLSFAGKSIGFPISTITILGNMPRQAQERFQRFQAYYLLELVNQALSSPAHFVNFRKALSRNDRYAKRILVQIGDALLTRYNPRGNRAGVFASQRSGSIYEKWRQTLTEQRSQNQAYLLRLANERNLAIGSAGHEFAVVFMKAKKGQTLEDIQAQLEKLRFTGLGLDRRDAEAIFVASAPFATEPETLIPWYLVSFVDPQGPVDLANYITLTTFQKRLHKQAQEKFVSQLCGSLLPLSHCAAKAVRQVIAARDFSKGNTTYLDRASSYGATLALLETQLYDLHLPSDHLGSPQELTDAPLFNALSSLGITPSLDSWDSTPFSEKLLQVTAALLDQNKNFEYTTSSPVKESQETKLRNIEVLGYLLGKPLAEASESDPISHRKKGRTLASLPSAEPLNSDSARKSQVSHKSRRRRSPLNRPNAPGAGDRKPVILFLVDGLRPDRFKQAVRAGWMPHLASMFYYRGVELESFTSRSLTLPSWATIFTGFEPDVHGLRSNTTASRIKERITDNFADARKDFYDIRNWQSNRAFRRLKESLGGQSEKIWLPDYFREDQVYLNYMPISHNPHYATWGIVGDYFNHMPEYANQVRFHADALDSVSAEMTAAAITKDATSGVLLRLIMNWYAGVDEASHYNNDMLPSVYRNIDNGIGKILRAAKQHPTLKDATLFLVSDHGHTGGYGPFGERSALRLPPDEITWDEKLPALSSAHAPRAPLLINTGFNVTKFLAGDFLEYPDYRFTIGTVVPPDPKFDLSMKNFLMFPYQSIYPRLSHGATALVDHSGDNMAQIYIKGSANWRRLTYRELTELHPHGMDDGAQPSNPMNLLSDLLHVRLPNLMVSHPGLSKRIAELTHHHPVGFIALGLTSPQARVSADDLGASDETQPSNKDPVLVIARGPSPEHPKLGLILTRTNQRGQDSFRYVVLKTFSQDVNGYVQAEISQDAEQDPLEYLGHVSGAQRFDLFRSDHQWLRLTRKHHWPTALFSLSRTLALAPRFTDETTSDLPQKLREKHIAETPDLVLIANPGFSFHSGEPMESDHGGLDYEEVRNSLFISSLKTPDSQGREHLRRKHVKLTGRPVLTRDIMPSVLEFAGFGEPNLPELPQTQGKSFKHRLDSVYFDRAP